MACVALALALGAVTQSNATAGTVAGQSAGAVCPFSAAELSTIVGQQAATGRSRRRQDRRASAPSPAIEEGKAVAPQIYLTLDPGDAADLRDSSGTTSRARAQLATHPQAKARLIRPRCVHAHRRRRKRDERLLPQRRQHRDAFDRSLGRTAAGAAGRRADPGARDRSPGLGARQASTTGEVPRDNQSPGRRRLSPAEAARSRARRKSAGMSAPGAWIASIRCAIRRVT